MKGRQLTLEEVLRLEDGTKVWVEDSDEGDEQVGVVSQEDGETLVFVDDGDCWFEIEDLFNCDEYVKFYEWTDDEYSNPMMLFDEDDNDKIVYSLAQEICNLRGLDLTEDNIDKIMKEFVDKE